MFIYPLVYIYKVLGIDRGSSASLTSDPSFFFPFLIYFLVLGSWFLFLVSHGIINELKRYRTI